MLTIELTAVLRRVLVLPVLMLVHVLVMLLQVKMVSKTLLLDQLLQLQPLKLFQVLSQTCFCEKVKRKKLLVVGQMMCLLVILVLYLQM